MNDWALLNPTVPGQVDSETGFPDLIASHKGQSMIGIIVPAHNEELLIGLCIESLLKAAGHYGLHGEAVEIVVVLDDCTDTTATVVGHYPVTALPVANQNVGKTRADGARYLIERGARWLAFTDADTVVPSGWLVEQLRFKAEAVCGTVRVDDWSLHSQGAQIEYDSRYCHAEGHRHIHGANLGISTEAYLKVGGFRPLPAHEDVHLVKDLEAIGSTIAWTALNCVTTSARLDCRCREGFGDYLRSLSDNLILSYPPIDSGEAVTVRYQ